jgi:hypothetical protein
VVEYGILATCQHKNKSPRFQRYLPKDRRVDCFSSRSAFEDFNHCWLERKRERVRPLMVPNNDFLYSHTRRNLFLMPCVDPRWAKGAAFFSIQYVSRRYPYSTHSSPKKRVWINHDLDHQHLYSLYGEYSTYAIRTVRRGWYEYTYSTDISYQN